MTVKHTYFIRQYDTEAPADTLAVAEVPLFRGLSAEDTPDFEKLLSTACADPRAATASPCSSIRFGFESLLSTQPDSAWLHGKCGIPINGLIWMGDKRTMARRIKEKLDAGFKVLKLKIGGIGFDDELDLIASLRRSFRPSDLTIRLDANGSFTPANALTRLQALSHYSIHSLEQPLRAGLTAETASICLRSPIPIALDEELIGLRTEAEARRLVADIRPQYLILKPSLCGGFAAADTYIGIARELGIGWWATSALESNIGLAAIAAWLAAKNIGMPQGLGTGGLYYNNVESPLILKGSSLWYTPGGKFTMPDSLLWKR